ATRQQVVRLDREPLEEPLSSTGDALIARVTALAARADAVLISDYGYGTITNGVLESVRALARKSRAIVTVDSRYDLLRFTGDTVISTFTTALASGATPFEAASLANVAGGVVVMKRGTATVSAAELRQALGETGP